MSPMNFHDSDITPFGKGHDCSFEQTGIPFNKDTVTQYSFVNFFAILLSYISFPMEKDKTLRWNKLESTSPNKVLFQFRSKLVQ